MKLLCEERELFFSTVLAYKNMINSKMNKKYHLIGCLNTMTYKYKKQKYA